MDKRRLVEDARAIRDMDEEIEAAKAQLKGLKDARDELVEKLIEQCENATQKTIFDESDN